MAQPATTVISSIHLLHRASQRADGLFARNVWATNLTANSQFCRRSSKIMA
jgi:hypothetical protein